jgi:hypothetical protein
MESDMKIASTAMMTAVAAVLLVLASASREGDARAQSGPGSIGAQPVGSARPAPAPLSASLEGEARSDPQVGSHLQRSELVGYDATDAQAPSAPPASPPTDARAAYLQDLVAQARQQNEQLAEIDDELAAQRRQAAQKEARRQAEARQESAQQAATLQALDTLRRAEAMLAFGNSDGVDDQLANASRALWGRTRLDVDAAREALANEDLFLARQYLAAALAERRR